MSNPGISCSRFAARIRRVQSCGAHAFHLTQNTPSYHTCYAADKAKVCIHHTEVIDTTIASDGELQLLCSEAVSCCRPCHERCRWRR